MTPQEYHDLMTETNSIIERHHVCSSPAGMLSMCLMVATCGCCFCPCIILACQAGDNIRSDMARLEVVQKLRAKNVEVRFYGGSKRSAGGMMFTCPPGGGGMVPQMVGADQQQMVAQQPQVGQMVMVQQADGSVQQMIIGPGGVPQPVIMLGEGEQAPEGATVVVQQVG